MNQKKRIVIVGATSSIATHCARLWVQGQMVDMTLIGRDVEKLNRLANDLRARSANSIISVILGDFTQASEIQATVDSIVKNGNIDVALIAHGSLSDQRQCEDDLSICQAELSLNGISPVLYAEAFVNKMVLVDCGTVVVIGSVAGDRGRKSNYVYGAAKGLVTRYMQGLQHRLANTNVKAILIKPGPTDTPMTASLKARGAKLARVEDVAASIIKVVDKGTPVAYVPGKWWLIMMIIRHLPTFIFNKMNI
jgi:decaprenylphospho-beta-D-erythro-pentofuranosid-2-ulose 2-reductase